MKRFLARIDEHFECAFLAHCWLSGEVLAILAGRPALGAIGAITVLPVLVAYAVSVRRGARAQQP